MTGAASLLAFLCAWDVGIPRIRLGDPNDGGYVCLDQRLGSALLGYGIGPTSEFESAFCDHFQVPGVAFDQVPCAPPRSSWVRFVQEGLTPTSLADQVREYAPGGATVKMDVEGAEWDALLGCRDLGAVAIPQLIVEWHAWADHPIRTATVWHHLREAGFVLYHLHGNNYGPMVTVDDHVLPATLEASYVRPRAVAGSAWGSLHYWPTSIDAPNDPRVPDLVFRTP